MGTNRWILTTTLLVGCGGGIPGELGVAPLASEATEARALRAAHHGARPNPGAYAFAQLEGLRLEVHEVSFEDVLGDRHGIGVSEVVELRPDDRQVPLQQPVLIPTGDFRAARLELDQSYEVKATCRTEDYLVYTTAAGVQRLDCAEADCTAPPADYDYTRYEFLYVTTAESAEATGDDAIEETLDPFSIGLTGTPRVAVLVDLSYLVTCYDGSGSNPGHRDALSPFGFHPKDAPDSSAFFPAGTPAFGLGYVPFMIWVSDDPNEALPVGETYVVADSPEGLDDPFADLMVTTFAFRADDAPLAARARNFDRASVDLNQYMSGFAQEDDGRYVFFNGEYYWDEDTPGRYVQDRKVEGFTRQALGADPLETAFVDGPECGQTLMTEHGNQSRPCLTESDPDRLWWRRIARD